uniref:Nascent polypeptide-associated complex subunit alpha-like UBA domain-containing protein n=1 Tax=Ditylenchus dipsaci TaxID=166011 RepID=A0A915DR44_9BILA
MSKRRRKTNSKALEKVEDDDSKMSKAEKRSRQILGKETRNLGIWPSYRSLQNSSSSTVEYLSIQIMPSMSVLKKTPAVTADEMIWASVSDKDIELVMSQSDCSKSAAIKALRNADGDLQCYFESGN